jgi:hypothetical protein
MRLLLTVLAGAVYRGGGCLLIIVFFMLEWIVSTAVWSLIVYVGWLAVLALELTTMEPTAIQVFAIGFLVAFAHTFLRTIFGSSSSAGD